MIITIKLPLLIVLSGMSAWLYTIYQVQRATAAVPAYATASPATLYSREMRRRNDGKRPCLWYGN